MKFLFKYPSRSRPAKFMHILEKYYNMLSGKHDFEFRITMDSNDDTMNNETIKSYLNSKKNLKYFYGNSRSKIEAINANMEDAQFDILLLISDDMMPMVQGYDDVIVYHMQKNFPDLDGALHFNDGLQGKNLNSLSIMGKKMYDNFGYIYHPDYMSLWSDNEFMEVTSKMNKVVYVDQVIIKHVWEGYGHIADALYKKNEKWFNRDKYIFDKRKMAGFPKESVITDVNRENDLMQFNNYAASNQTSSNVVNLNNPLNQYIRHSPKMMEVIERIKIAREALKKKHQ